MAGALAPLALPAAISNEIFQATWHSGKIPGSSSTACHEMEPGTIEPNGCWCQGQEETSQLPLSYGKRRPLEMALDPQSDTPEIRLVHTGKEAEQGG